MEDLINEMSNVTVDIKNREFLIACEDGKEEEVLELAKIFSERVSKLSERLNDLDHERLFLLAGILAEEDNKNLLKALLASLDDEIIGFGLELYYVGYCLCDTAILTGYYY